MLSKITPRQFKNIPTPYKHLSMPMVDPDPLCSNVYCIGERIMLLWMNFHYEHQRKTIWEGGARGNSYTSVLIIVIYLLIKKKAHVRATKKYG